MGNHAGTVIAFWSMLDLLGLVTAFGVGTGLSMVFRRWWFSFSLFLAFSVYLIIRYASRMTVSEWLLYAMCFVGVGCSAIAVRMLKKNGYPLFS